MSIQEVSIAFSNGKFDEVYEFIAENAVWIVVGETTFTGKKAIVDNCSQVADYFKSVTTNFGTDDVITEANKVVVKGTAEFLRNQKRLSFVSACDVYEFNEMGQIQKITSYCISTKNRI